MSSARAWHRLTSCGPLRTVHHSLMAHARGRSTDVTGANSLDGVILRHPVRESSATEARR